MAVREIGPGPSGGGFEDFERRVFGPFAVDDQIKKAIWMCWMLLPAERRTVEAVAAEVRRIVERALLNLKDDDQIFREPPKGE